MTAPHQCFTVSTTAYLRNLSAEDRREECFAIHYQKADEDLGEGRKAISMRAPVLIVSHWMANQKSVGERIAAILNDHYEQKDSATTAANTLRDAGLLTDADYHRTINRIAARERLREVMG